MLEKPKEYAIIHWQDSTSQPGWGNYIMVDDDMDCITVGILYKEDDISYVIAQNFSPHDYGEYIRIPKFAVSSIKKHKLA